MWILIAEMLLALGIIVFIMWWTLRARVDHPLPDEANKNPASADQDVQLQKASKGQQDESDKAQ